MSETFTIQQAARRTGLSVPTLRYYEQVGLIDPVPRGESSGHREYDDATVQAVEALACLRTTGMSIEDMRRYRDHMASGDAAEQRALFATQVERVSAEIEGLELRREYLREKVRLWSAREDGDPGAEARAAERLVDLAARL
jgi:DNA-binding transcriptional MerR regulator